MVIDISRIKKLLKERCDFSFNEESTIILKKVIVSRMQMVGMSDVLHYYNLLVSDDMEFYHLVDIVTINNTFFFRERETIDLFVEKLAPELLKSKNPGYSVRVLSAGCSSGEDPYSIAMALLEKYGKDAMNSFSISAFDVDGPVMNKAKKALYGERSFVAVDEDFTYNYFIKDQRHLLRLKDDIRLAVDFYSYNLLKGGYEDTFAGVDVIFYRGISGYFSRENQMKILGRLAGLLREGGYLILGKDEAKHHNSGILMPIVMDGSLIFQKDSSYVKEISDSILPTNEGMVRGPFKLDMISNIELEASDIDSGGSLEEVGEPGVELLMSNAQLRRESEEYNSAIKLVDDVLKIYPDHGEALILKATLLLESERFDEIKDVVKEITGSGHFRIEARIIVGLSAKKLGDMDAALKHFKDAVYADASCWLAHFYLGECFRENLRSALAIKEFESVREIIDKKGFFSPVMKYMPMSFTEEHFMSYIGKTIAVLKRSFKGEGAGGD